MAYVYTPDPVARTISLTFDFPSQSDAFYTAYDLLDRVRCQDIKPALNIKSVFHYVTDAEYNADKAAIEAILATL